MRKPSSSSKVTKKKQVNLILSLTTSATTLRNMYGKRPTLKPVGRAFWRSLQAKVWTLVIINFCFKRKGVVAPGGSGHPLILSVCRYWDSCTVLRLHAYSSHLTILITSLVRHQVVSSRLPDKTCQIAAGQVVEDWVFPTGDSGHVCPTSQLE